MNILPESGWFHNVVTVWQKAKRPSKEKIESLIEGYFEALGVVEWKDPYFYIKLQGTPKVFDYKTMEYEPYSHKPLVREIYVVLESDRIVVKSATQDRVTQRLAAALSETLYGIQGYQDEACKKGAA